MVQFRKWLVTSLIALLLLTPLQAFAQPATSGTDNPDGTSYVRIKNDWKGTYLFEDQSGKVRYGFTAVSDPAAQWSFTDIGGGKTTIRNRATGHLLDMTSVTPDDKITASVEATTADSSLPAAQWKVNAVEGKPGLINVVSSGYDNRLLNVQTQDDYAHVNNWAQPSWGSAQWKLEPAETIEPVRILSQWKGTYLFDDGGKVKEGTPAMTDWTSQWFVETKQGKTAIRNRATGNYLNMKNVTAPNQQEDAVQTLPWTNGEDSELWKIAASSTKPGYVSVTSSVYDERVLNIEAQNGYAHVNNWAQSEWGSALWKLEPAADINPVRMKEAWKGTYLYEQEDGSVSYGNPAGTDKASQWMVIDSSAGSVIRNVYSGNYLSPDADPTVMTVTPSAWAKAAAKDSNNGSVDNYYTFAKPEHPEILLNVQDQKDMVHVNNWAQATWGSAQWKLEDPAAPEPVKSYIRIKNNWLGLYLYEEDGIVKYGNALAGDAKSEWLIVQGDGFKRIQNRATGHFINLDGVSNSRQALKATDLDDGSAAGNWVIEDYQGYKEIHSVADRNDVPGSELYINVENKLKVAQYGTVNRDWGSPKWEFVPADASGKSAYILLKNSYNNSYLYEENGVVKDGQPDVSNPASHWFLKQGEKGTLIVNRATGHLISNENVKSYEDPLQALDIDPTWASSQWKVTDAGGGKSVFQSIWKDDQRIHDEDRKGFAQSSGVPADWGSAQWLSEAAPMVPLQFSEDFIRIKNENNGQYLYENGRNVVLYGQPDTADSSSHWQIITTGDGQRLVNRATGHVISMANLKSYLETSSQGASGEDRSLWHIEAAPVAGAYLIRSGTLGHEDEYVNVEDSAGYAQYDLRSIESKAVQWRLETAPAEAHAPSAEAEDVNGITPSLSDRNVYRLQNDDTGMLLTDSGNGVAASSNAGVVASALWSLDTYNGLQRLVNLSTGKYLAVEADGTTISSSSDGAALNSQWRLNKDAGQITLSSSLPQGGILSQQDGNSQVKLTASGSHASGIHSKWLLQPVTGIVTYEAENAFTRGGVLKGSDDGVVYAKGFETEGAGLIFAVHAPAPGQYSALLKYRTTTDNAQKLTLQANGGTKQTVSFAAGTGWKEAWITIQLRESYNAVSLAHLAGDLGQVEIDSLKVYGSSAPKNQGADMPYTTYEAENMNTNGSAVVDNRTYGTFAAESSGRQAVRLDKTGDYVSFKLAKTANAINLRYILPDSMDGTGNEKTLSLYVNGEKRTSLTLSSKYSWVYGKYPYSNDPADGDAHRFYDEAQQLVGTIPAGATVMLRKDEGDTADYYVLDFAELEQAPDAFTMPDGFVSAVQYGAIPNDGQDDTAALKSAITAAQASGFGVWLPAGAYQLSGGPIDVKNVTISGAGMWHTKLTGEGFMGIGDQVQIQDLTVDVDVTVRHDELKKAAFDGAFGKGSTIQNVWIRHAKAGVWTTLSDDLTLNTEGLYLGGLRVRDTYADGVHFSTGTKYSVLEHSSVRNTGDDAVALWSAQREGVSDELARTEGNLIRNNTIQLPTLADNVAVFGGKDNVIADNWIADTMGYGAGIAVSTRFDPVPFSGTTIVEGNTLLRTGGREANWNQDFGAIWIFADNDRNIDADIQIRNNVAIDSTFQGLYISGGENSNINHNERREVLIDNFVIDGAGTWGIQVNSSVTGSVDVSNVLVRNAKLGRLFNGVGSAFTLNAVDTIPGNGIDRRNPAVVPDVSSGESGTTTPVVKLPVDSSASLLDNELNKAVAAKPAVIPVQAVAQTDGGAIASFSLKALKEAAAALPESKLSVRYENVSYELPLKWIANWMANQPSVTASPDAVLQLSLAQVEASVLSAMKQQATASGLSLVDGTQYRFELQAIVDGKSIPLNRFGSVYVDRTLTVSGTLDSTRSTALVYDPNARSFRYVPALFHTADGKTVVTIRSTTNSIYTIAASTRTFGDIAEHWAKADIELLAAKQILNGQSATAFAPNRPVSRAEFAVMLVRALGVTADAANPAGSNFKDVKATDWFAADIAAAVQYGFTQGNGNGRFGVSDSITREQMAVMVAAALKLSPSHDAAPANPASGLLNKFGDAGQVSGWAQGAVETLLEGKLLEGRSASSFAPKGVMTRAEAAVVLKRLLQSMNLLDQ